MLQHLDLTVSTPSERFDIVVFSNRAIFSYAFKKLIEENTSLKVALLSMYAVYYSRLDENFSGLLVFCLETTDASSLEILHYIKGSLPLARVMVILSAYAEVSTQDIQCQAHSIWSESSTILELLEAAIITLKGGSWIDRQISAHLKRVPELKDFPQVKAQEDISPSQLKRLTEREIQILQLMSEGHSNQYIAEHLFISVSTVKNHSARLFMKLGARNRTGAVIKAIEAGLLSKDAVCIS